MNYSNSCYTVRMDRREVLREVMRESGTSQSELSRITGVHQPSISHLLSGRVEMSDDMLDRLVSGMGFRVETIRRPVKVRLQRSEERSWRLHRQISRNLNHSTLENWLPTMRRNLKRLRSGTRGEPHERNLRRWEELIDRRDVLGLHRVLTGVDRDSIEMREVSPMSGLLSQRERSEILG
jgi:Plasmid maintenance system antidote protein